MCTASVVSDGQAVPAQEDCVERVSDDAFNRPVAGLTSPAAET
jgi:hypothetical protein